MMKTLIFTLDYELYGNGSGNVFTHIVEPTNKILEIADKYNAKITFFFEVVEYWKLKAEWEKGNYMGYTENPILAMEEQLRYAHSKGHDIQLHIHPQWVDAKWDNGKWTVNNQHWRLGGYEGVGENSLHTIIKRGKETIETIIGNGYKCSAIRAGGYNAQPSDKIMDAMKDCGLKADSSIVPGAIESGSLSKYDYSMCRNNIGYWYCKNALEKESADTTGIIELPIVAFPIVRIQKYLSKDRIKSLLQNRNSAKEAFDAKTGDKSNGIISKFKFFFEKEYQTWDFCLFSKGMHRKFLKQISKQTEREVFVLVGHPKSYTSGDGLEYILNRTVRKYRFITTSEFLSNAERD